MIILGIDPGFARMGYAVLESTREDSKIIECSCIETSSDSNYENRLALIADKIKYLLAEYKPEALAIEKIFFAANQKTALKIAEVRGILLYLAVSEKIPVFEYTPLEVKMSLCGYGKASKDQVQKMVKILLKIQSLPKLDDAVDAIAIALACASCLPLKSVKN